MIAVNGLDDAPGYGASAEAGSFGFARASGSARARHRSGQPVRRGRFPARDRASTASMAPGDKDGYRNLSGRLRGNLAVRVRMSSSAPRPLR